MKRQIKVGAAWLPKAYELLRQALWIDGYEPDENGDLRIPSHNEENNIVASILGRHVYLQIRGFFKPGMPWPDVEKAMRNFGLIRRSDDTEADYDTDGIRYTLAEPRQPKPVAWVIPDIEIIGVDESLKSFLYTARKNPNSTHWKKSTTWKKNLPENMTKYEVGRQKHIAELIGRLEQLLLTRIDDAFLPKSVLQDARAALAHLLGKVDGIAENYEALRQPLTLADEDYD